MQSIYLAGGCFWCTEAIYLKLKGIQNITPGYIGGVSKNPTYKEVCKGMTGHAEAIKCDFDEKVISLELILEVFFVATKKTSKINSNEITFSSKSHLIASACPVIPLQTSL